MIKNSPRIYRFVLFCFELKVNQSLLKKLSVYCRTHCHARSFSKHYLKVVVSKLLPMLAGEKAVVRGGEAEVG